MSIQKIITEPDPILRKKSEPFEKINKDVKKLMNNMLETMYDAPGIGLAAIQIGIRKRAVVIDVTKNDAKKNPLFFINPKIVYQSKKTSIYEEGCLSLPGQFAEIERPAECHVKFLDLEGNEKEIKADGLLATCIQHEVDHLDGILFIDYLSKLKRTMIIKKLSKQKKSLERIVV